MKSFFRIFTILSSKQRRICVGIVIIMLLGAVFEVGGIGLLYPLIDIIRDPNYLEKHLKLRNGCIEERHIEKYYFKILGVLSMAMCLI